MFITILLYIITVVVNVVANISFKIGTKSMAVIGVAPFSEVFKSVFNKWFLIGVLAFAVSFPTFVMLISRQKISIAYPVITGWGFLFITLVGVFWLKEDISAIQIIGICVIFIGLVLAGLSR